ncbi:MAG: aldo/keto reductase [Rhodospirillales bacterium]|nr:aldo/keto reductase [Rhodospirillales bacterium]
MIRDTEAAAAHGNRDDTRAGPDKTLYHENNPAAPSRDLRRLGLGTAQFGLDYAIDCRETRPDEPQIAEILAAAAASGMDVLDTAPAYGNAETILGRTLPPTHRFRIVTKTTAFPDDRMTPANADALIDQFHRSLSALRVRSVYGLMIHKVDNLLGAGGGHLFEAMETLRADGVAGKIGASVYSADQIELILDRFPIDLIQLPVSILDQRLIESGHLRVLKQRGVEVHARSAFLKGLIFADPAALPSHFGPVGNTLSELRFRAGEAGLDVATAALTFLLDLDDIDTVLIGVTKTSQLAKVLDGVRESAGARIRSPQSFSVADPAIVNPALWPDFKTVAAQ